MTSSTTLLYDVFVHGSAERPDEVGIRDTDGFYDVTEAEHIRDSQARSLMRRSRAELVKRGRQRFRACAQRLRCGKERRVFWWFDMEDDTDSQALLKAMEEENASVERMCPWQVLLSPQGDRLAILKEDVVSIRSDRTGFAQEEEEHTLPARKSSTPTNFAALSSMLSADSSIEEYEEM